MTRSQLAPASGEIRSMNETIQHINPEDPDAVRRRDRAYLDSKGRQRRTRRDIGNAWPVKSGAQGNSQDAPSDSLSYRPIQPGSTEHLNMMMTGGDRLAASSTLSARQEAYLAGAAEESLTPAVVEEVLTKPQLYRDRLDPQRWKILSLAYGKNLSSALPEERPRQGKVTDAAVAEMIDRSKSTVQEQRTEALTMADELVRLWKPALDKWRRIQQGNRNNEQLTPEDEALLKKHSRRRIGRRTAEDLERSVQRHKKRRQRAARLEPTTAWTARDEAESQQQLDQARVTLANSRSKEQAEWVGQRSVENEQALEQANEAFAWKSNKLTEWAEEDVS
jgi:hypothetical protein